MRRVVVAGALAAAMVTGVPASTATGAPRRDQPSGCAIAGATQRAHQAQRATAGAYDDEGMQESRRWLADGHTQQLNAELHRQAEALLGAEPPGGERIADRLRRGVVGYTLDDTTQTLGVVVTPESRAADTLPGRVDSARRRFTGVSAYAPQTSVVASCRDAAGLIAADDLLHGRSWHPDAALATYTYRLDAADSTYHVSFDARYPEAADALRAALGDLVDVRLGAYPMQTGRYDDGEPHYGGAGIRVGSGTTATNTCSSGFMIRRNSDGRKGMASAGHCFSNGQSIYSGPEFYGVTADKSAASDAIGIYSTTETYAPVIHVEPCSPCIRTVVGWELPLENEYVCISGMSSQALCSIRVVDNLTSACWSFGCVSGLILGERWDRTIVKPGDSGGPMYTRPGSTTARIAGMIIGQDPYSGGYQVYASRLGMVEDALNATLVTG